MRGAAKHWVSYKGTLYKKGDIIEIDPSDVREMSEYCDIERKEDEDVQSERRPRRRRKED